MSYILNTLLSVGNVLLGLVLSLDSYGLIYCVREFRTCLTNKSCIFERIIKWVGINKKLGLFLPLFWELYCIQRLFMPNSILLSVYLFLHNLLYLEQFMVADRLYRGACLGILSDNVKENNYLSLVVTPKLTTMVKDRSN